MDADDKLGKYDPLGRRDPTRMTAEQRREYTRNRIHEAIFPLYPPIVDTDEPIAEWLTLSDPTLFGADSTLMDPENSKELTEKALLYAMEKKERISTEYERALHNWKKFAK